MRIKNSVAQPNESTPPRHTDNSELVVNNMFYKSQRKYTIYLQVYSSF